jgi:hypothetical protein
MKKIIILILIATTSLIAFSQVHLYQSSTINIDNGNGYEGEIKNKSNIYINFDDAVVYIDGVESYAITYVERYSYQKYNLIKCITYDSSGRQCNIEFYLYRTVFYMKFIYSNLIFKYKVPYEYIEIVE